MAGTKEAAEFYDRMIQLEKDVQEIKDEAEQAMAAFATNNEVHIDAVKRGIKDRKAYLKDKGKFLLIEDGASKVFELFDYDPNGNLFEEMS